MKLLVFHLEEFRAIIGQTRKGYRQAWPNTDCGMTKVAEQGCLRWRGLLRQHVGMFRLGDGLSKRLKKLCCQMSYY